MKKILILVMSSPSIEPYGELIKKQKETWDSVFVENVKTIFYYANPEISSPVLHGTNLSINIEENILNNTIKFKKSLQYVINMDWDFIFRTNASSYIDKRRLLNYCQTLPIKGCYCGIDGGRFASGSGCFISRDLVECLINNISDNIQHIYEDAFTGDVIERFCGYGVRGGATRIEYNHSEKKKGLEKILFTEVFPYHYRCKSLDGDRKKDLEAMDTIFKYMEEKELL